MYQTKFVNFFKMNNLGAQIEIFVKFMFKIFIAFVTQKPSTDNQKTTFDTSITPVPLSLKPLHIPLRIYSDVKPMLLRSIYRFISILQHRETGEFLYHYTRNNNQLLSSPHPIRNQQGLDTLLSFLASQDFPSHLKDQCPNTKWVIERIVSLRIHLVMTTYPLGNPLKLPDYIKNNRHIIALGKDQHLDTRTISAFSGVLLLGSTNSPATTVTEIPNNSFKITAIIFKSILKILKVLNGLISFNSKHIMKPN